MAKYRVAVIGTVGKSVLIDDSLSSRVARLETQIATVGGVTRHSQLLGLQQGDDHPQYTMWQAPETIAAPWNFSVIPFIQGETLAEYIEDVVAGGTDPFIADSPSIIWTYDDTGNHLQADVVDEYIEDLVGSMLVNTTYIDLDYGDSDGSIKAILDTGAVLDLVGTASFQDSSTIDFTYNSGTKRTSAEVVQSFSYSWTGNHTFTPASGNTVVHAGNFQLNVDNQELQIGASQDLRLFHDGTNSIIRNDTGNLLFQEGTTEVARLMSTGYFRAATRVGAGIDPIAPVHGYRSGVNGAGTAAVFVMDTDQKTTGDGLGTLYRGLDSSDAVQNYGFFVVTITSPTAGAASASFDFATVNGGAGPTTAWRMMPGGAFAIKDGITAPSTLSGFGQIYIDVADGDLKIIFGDGTVKTIVTDT